MLCTQATGVHKNTSYTVPITLDTAVMHHIPYTAVYYMHIHLAVSNKRMYIVKVYKYYTRILVSHHIYIVYSPLISFYSYSSASQRKPLLSLQ